MRVRFSRDQTDRVARWAEEQEVSLGSFIRSATMAEVERLDAEAYNSARAIPNAGHLSELFDALRGGDAV